MVSRELQNLIYGSYGVQDLIYGYNDGHPSDEKSAKEAIHLAAKENVSLEEFVEANRQSLLSRDLELTDHLRNHIKEQLLMVRWKAALKFK